MTSSMTMSACDPAKSCVVKACAGSGKTWLLISRIVRLLLGGVEPKDILAITFTRKAAEEMRGRLDEILRDLMLCSDSDLVQHLVNRGVPNDQLTALLPKARGLFESVLSRPQGVTIHTFHGWFARMLSAAPLGARVPMGASLREDAMRLQKDCLRTWWPTLRHPDNKELLDAYELLVNELGAHNARELLIGTKGFLSIKGEWFLHRQGMQSMGKPVEECMYQLSTWLDQSAPFPTALKNSAWINDWLALAQLLAQGSLTEQKEAAAIHQALQNYSHHGDLEKLRLAIRYVFLTQDLTMRAKTGPTRTLEKILELRADKDQLVLQIQLIKTNSAQLLLSHEQWAADQRALSIFRAWVLLGESALAHYQTQKDHLRAQDFSDLESQMSELMTSSEMAAYMQARLDANYKHILIDEFQDTNPLQWKILKAWLDAYGEDADKPSVFLVGDAKQSIYRFRRADARLFHEAADFLNKHFHAQVLEQTETRRNSLAVLNAVNRIFTSDAVPPGYDYPVQSRHPDAIDELAGQACLLPLIPYIELGDDGIARDPMAKGLLPDGYAGILQAQAEGRRLANLILLQRQQHQAVWGDFLVLVRSRTNLQYIEKALRDAGIPCDGAQKGGLLSTLEASDLSALLHVLLTPTDQLQLAQVLKSPIYQLSDEDLMTLMLMVRQGQAPTLWDALAIDSRFEVIRTQISSWRRLSETLPVHDLLDHIFSEAAIRVKYAQAVSPLEKDQVISNLDAYLRLALNVDGGRYPSLSRFIRELRLLSAGEEQETPDEGEYFEGADSSDIENSRVRVMTIHAAKGLEAKFVILLHANAKPTQHEEGVLVSWDPHQTYPQHISPRYSANLLDTARQSLREAEAEIALRENWNLLYVALTRAKQSVFISGRASSVNKEIESGSWYDIAQSSGIELVDFEFDPASQNSPACDPHSSIRDYQIQWSGDDMRLDRAATEAENPEAIELGVAFHRVMECLARNRLFNERDLPSSEELSRWLQLAQPIADQLIHIVRKLLKKPLVTELFNSAAISRTWEELDIEAADGCLLRIDRLIETNSELIILDYKLSIPEEHDERFHDYVSQLNGYAQAVLHLRQDKPVRKVLISAQGDVQEIS